MKLRNIIALGAVAVIGGLGIWHFRDQLTSEALIEHGKTIPATALAAGFLILPLVGFPISIPLVLAGLRWGFWGGAAVALVCILFHHIAAYFLCRGKPGQWLKQKLPQGKWALPDTGASGGVWSTVLFAAFHGPPYFLKVYLLALTNPKFPVFIFVGGSVYWLFGLIPLGAAAAAKHVDVTWLYIAIAVISGAMLLWKWRKNKNEQSET